MQRRSDSSRTLAVRVEEVLRKSFFHLRNSSDWLAESASTHARRRYRSINRSTLKKRGRRTRTSGVPVFESRRADHRHVLALLSLITHAPNFFTQRPALTLSFHCNPNS
jgi:hypothetical protein